MNTVKSGEKGVMFFTLALITLMSLTILSGCEKKTLPPIVDVAVEKNDTIQPLQDQKAAVQEFYEEKNCGEGTAVGYKSCSYTSGGDVTVTLEKKKSEITKNTFAGIRVIYLKTMVDGMKKQNVELGNETIMAPQNDGMTDGPIAYSVNLADHPESEKIEIRPIIDDGSVKKVCYNQRIIVIPGTNCKR